MSKIRVCFLGTTDFSVECLKALIRDEHYQVVGVVTQPDRPAGRKLQLTPSPVKLFAQSHGLPVLAPESLKANQLILQEIATWNAEVAVVVAFGQILQESFLNSFHYGAVNVHASLLPRWRGAAPIQRAIEAGDTLTGVCLQKMVKKLDAGGVIGERKIEISGAMNSLELHDKLAFLGADLMHVELMDYIRGNLGPHLQDETLVTYAHKIEKTESELNWNLPAQQLHNKIRAFVWGPGTFTLDNKKRLKVHRAAVKKAASPQKNQPGTVVSVNHDSFTVACGEDFLEIFEVQPESRSKITFSEWNLSRKLQIGDRF